MTFGHCQDHSILREFPMCQILVPRCETGGKSSIQSAGQYGFNLIDRKEMMQLQLHVRLPTPQFAKGVYNQSMPGYGTRNSDSKRTALVLDYTLAPKPLPSD